MDIRIISLDIAAAKTGWAFTDGNEFEYGWIETSPKDSRALRLAKFRISLTKILEKYKPTHIVFEDVYSGPNKKVLILLAKFAGVAEELCYSFMEKEPYVMHTNTVKAYFKVKSKEDVFNVIVSLLKLEKFTFKEHNDITDAVAQLLCYCDNVLCCKKFRTEKEYGYLYEVD